MLVKALFKLLQLQSFPQNNQKWTKFCESSTISSSYSFEPIVLRRHDVEVEEPSQAASFCRSNGVMSSIEPVESRRAVGGAHCDLSPSACLPFWQTNKKHILLLWITLYQLHILQSTMVSTSTIVYCFVRNRHHFKFLAKWGLMIFGTEI